MGNVAGLPVVFLLMAVSFVLAAAGRGPRSASRAGRAPPIGRSSGERGRERAADRLTRRPAAPDASAIMPGALYNGHSVGAWRSLVARIVRDDKVVGSNPAAPTIPPASVRSNSAGGRWPRPSA